MKRFYQAADLQQAHILAGLLREAGVDARVFHGNAQGAFGELPHVPPEIWLGNEKDAVQAREIVQAFERTPSAQGAVFCRGCGEESPANFELCWKCGTGL